MKRNVAVLVIIGCFLLSLCVLSDAGADTILFPFIAVNQPSVTTIVSIVSHPVYSNPTHLKYIYRYKDSLLAGGVPNLGGTCEVQTFTRANFPGDIVSFDASGILNSGNALFGDSNSYGGGFGLSGSGPRRAYLLVTNANAAGGRVDALENALSGEAMVIDIASGATWGYKAINDITRKDYSFFNEFGQGGGVSVAMPDSSDGAAERFSFHPTNEWTTKFFVTPIGHDMDYSNNLAEIHIVSAGTGIEGVYDRNGIRHQFPEIEKSVRCTGVINLEDMLGSSVLSEIDDIGGWTWATAR